jgi:predicted Fe-Mo cluster-binding NifX family protein
MKIAFPIMDNNGFESSLAYHFGRAPFFALVESKTGEINIIENAGDHFGGMKATPKFLNDHNVNLLICQALGRKAITLFKQLEIDVKLTKEKNVKAAYDAFCNGQIANATEADGCSGRH